MRILKAFLQMLALLPVFCLAFIVAFFFVCMFFLCVGLIFSTTILFGCSIIVGVCLFLLFALPSLIELPFAFIFKKPIYSCQFGKRFFGFCRHLIGGVSNFVEEEIVFKFLDLGESAIFFFDYIICAMEKWGGLFNATGNAIVWLDEVCEGARKFKNAKQ